MYQYLIGGRISEVCGDYKPLGTDAFTADIQINNKKVPAVLFKIKTARRKGKLRICALPINDECEPWTKQVFDWFQKHGDECPFIFMKRGNLKHNKRYMQWKAEEIFEGYGQPMDEYYSDDGKIPERTKKFTSDGLRKLRGNILREFYHFNDEELKIFSGLSKLVYDVHDNIANLTRLSEKYFKKLLRSISQLGREEFPLYLQVKDYKDLTIRYNRSAEISILVRNINMLGQAKLETPFFKENMRIVLEMLSPCETEPQFITKIASLSALFEVDLEPLKNMIQKPNWRRNDRIIKRWLIQKKINIDEEMLITWSNIKLLRNMEPIHSETDPSKLMEILNYFGEPLSFPINYSSLWDKILNKFRMSLKQFRDILNNL